MKINYHWPFDGFQNSFQQNLYPQDFYEEGEKAPKEKETKMHEEFIIVFQA